MSIVLISGLILGLGSNFHCIGMCGPIAMAVPLNRSSNSRILFGILQYNTGRIASYTILGAIAGSVGLTINTFGLLQWLSIISGVLLVLFAWRKYFYRLFPKLHVNPIFSVFISNALSKTMRSGSVFKLGILGSLNGLLPCGMVFVGLTNALLAGSIYGSSLAMLAFGLGTLPSMIIVALVANRVTPSIRRKMNKVVPYMLTVVGILIVFRGLNLNIPYLSPSVHEGDNATDSSNKNIEMSCCHSADNCE